MAKTVTTIDEDMIDHLVWRETGRISGPLEIVLDANRHLAKYPPVLPAGVTVTLPDRALEAPPARPPVLLWE